MVQLRTRLREEQGATLVLMSLTLVVLLGFSALVIDIGDARQQKRQVANTADSSALGGAQELPDLADVATEVKNLALENYGIPLADWTAANCPSSPPSGFSEWHSVDGTPCVSYNSSFTRVAVVTPTRIHNTTFAKAIGVNQLKVSAMAVAQRMMAGLGTVQPYGLYGSAPGNGEVCLVTGATPPTAPCNGPNTGNFGLLDIHMYGNPALPTTQRCSGNDDQLRNNVAIGIDHEIDIYSGNANYTNPNPVLDYCSPTDPPNPNPDTLKVKTGASNAWFDDGMLKASSSSIDDNGPAKLQRLSDDWTASAWPTRSVAGYTVDNKPLWDFIGDDNQLTDVPNTCRRAVFETIAGNSGLPESQKQPALHTALQTCFDQYKLASPSNQIAGCGNNACTGAVFNRNSQVESPIDLVDIQHSTRFIYVPQFHESQPPNGASAEVHVKAFKAVFLQRLLMNCSGNSCVIDFEPGTGTTPMTLQGQGNAAAQISGMTGFAFHPTMLPGNLGTNPFALGETMYISLVK